MASISRVVAKDCRLQPCDAVYRSSRCLPARRLQTQLVIRGAFRVPEDGKRCLALHTKPRNSIVALSAPASIVRHSRYSRVLCKAAANEPGDNPGSAPSEMTQYKRIVELLTTLFPVWVCKCNYWKARVVILTLSPQAAETS